MAQTLHAFREFISQYPELESEWYKKSNYICILSANNELELNKLIEKCALNNIKYSIFNEPDYDNALTAVVLEPGDKSKKITSNFPLALKGL